ncbi:MAG TPA: hypothetical protein VHR66_03325 [Gemmataceae bacterium]|nr:hypothetical protein [Gemmataceae bacterium]
MFRIVFLSSLCSLCFCGENLLHADPAVATYLFPAGGQRGTSVKFHVGGLYLNQSCSLEMLGRGVEASPVVRRVETPWFEGPVLPLPESQRQEDYPRAMAGSVKIAGDAPLGDRHVILRTAQGITNPLKFVVGNLPEIVEDEVDGEPIPVPVAAPVTINGRIFPHEDIDIWSVALKKGETLTAIVDAERIGSPLQAKLDIHDPAGKLVAEGVAAAGHDPRARFTAPADGVYQLHITDARSDGGPAFVYRLTLTTGPVVDRVFPLGGRRGQPVELEVSGSGVPSRTTVTIPKNSGLGTLTLATENGPSLPFSLDVDDLPEVRETDSPDPVRGNFLAGPSIANGRIAMAGEVDRWSFSAHKGDVLELDLRAARLGSPLLGVMTITDTAGKELARAEAGTGNVVDPSLRFTAPVDGIFFATVQDRFRGRSGPAFAYRLRLARPEPSFDLSVSTLGLAMERGKSAPLRVVANRHGSYAGPIALSIDGLPDGVTAPTDIVIAAGQPQIDVQLKADATAKVQATNIRVRGTAMISLAPLTAMLLPVTQTATWPDDPSVHQVRLAVAVPTPFKIAGDYEMKLIPRGTVHSRKYRIERNGFTGPIEIELADKQARHLQGATGPKLIIPGDKNEFDYPVTLPPWMETGRTCRVCVMGTGTVEDADGTRHVVTYSSREQNDQVIAVVEPERLGLRLDRPTVLVEPGKSAAIKIEVRRGDGLAGDALVEVLIPRSVKGVTAASTRVTAATSSGIVTLQFAADANAPFPAPLTLRATVMVDGKPVTAERKLDLVAPH